MTSLQFISHHNERFSYLDGIRMALDGGCKWIQLRMKEASDEEFLATARVARQLCTDANATFIIDDRVHLVKTVDADGVHLGQNDMPILEARKLIDGRIIGMTANTEERIFNAFKEGADYIGCGPFRHTTTKSRIDSPLGIDGYRRLLMFMNRHSIDIPFIAIGGITSEDILSLSQAGVRHFAVSGGILNADNPIEETKKLIQLINHGK